MTKVPVSDRLEALTQLFRTFDEIGRSFSVDPAPAPSAELRDLLNGRLSSTDYFAARIEVSVQKLASFMDAEDLNYVRQACQEILKQELMQSRIFAKLQTRLRGGQLLGHTQTKGAHMNQDGNTAVKGDAGLGSEDLQQLKRGEITMDEYVERRLQRQIEQLNLERMLTEAELEKLRRVMRENFLKSPLFRDLANKAAGTSGGQ